MKMIDRIKAMDVENFAKFLICEGEESDWDEDGNGDIYTYTEPCYCTPFGKYPGWMSEEDVVEQVVRYLLSEERTFDEDEQ